MIDPKKNNGKLEYKGNFYEWESVMGWYDEPEDIKQEYERRASENKREAGKLWHLYKDAERSGDYEAARRLHDAAEEKYSKMAENIAKSRNIDDSSDFDY